MERPPDSGHNALIERQDYMLELRDSAAAIAGADIINSATPLEQELLGVHPRLYAKPDAFDRIRSRLADPCYASAWTACLQSAEKYASMTVEQYMQPADRRGHYSTLPNLAFVWAMTGERRLFEAALRFTDAAIDAAIQDFGNTLIGGHFAHGVAVALDWLWHDLDESRRARWCDDLARLIQADFSKHWISGVQGSSFWYTCNHFAVGLSGLTAAACALYGERPGMAPLINIAQEKARLAVLALGDSGISPEGVGYGQYYVTYMVKVMQLLSDLTGMDLFAESPWWRKHALGLIQHSLPRNQWTPGTTFMPWGDAHTSHWYGPDVALRACAKAYRDPLARWLADACEDAQVNLSDYEKCYPLLLTDERLPSHGPTELPRMHHFEDFGLMMARSDWSGKETVCGFLCGPSYGKHAMRLFRHPAGGGHMHAFAGHFQIFSHGEYVLPPAGYTTKTAAYHNVLTVNDHGHVGESASGWFEDLDYRRGRPTPRMLFVEDCGTAVHAAGDATDGYRTESGVLRHIRHFIYLRPSCWVVTDILEMKACATVRLYFHTGFPMRPDDNGAWIGAGKLAGLRIRSLSGCDLHYFEQETLDHTFRPLGPRPCLTIEQAVPAGRTVFTTVVEAGPADDVPRHEVGYRHDGNELEAQVNGQSFRIPLHGQ